MSDAAPPSHDPRLARVVHLPRSRRANSERPAWHRSPRTALLLIVMGAVLPILVGVCGPSVVALTLGRRTSLLPPWYIPVSWFTLPEWTAAMALWLAITVGAVGLVIALRAVRDGWRPHVPRLFGLGVVLNLATALTLPLTSADVLMYAAYGRLQVLGMNPYEIPPAEIFRMQYDPVLIQTEWPWQDTPSVYGPLASFSQYLANILAGPNMHDVVFWLQMFCVLPMIGLSLIVLHMARGNPVLRVRATLLTIMNPCILWAVVAGAHNEALAVIFGIAALAMMRRSAFVAGLLIGLAGCVKINMVMYGLAMMWGYRRERGKLIQLCVGALIPIALCYGLWQPDALFAATRNTSYVNAAAWAFWLYTPLRLLIGQTMAKVIVNIVALVGLVVVVRILSRLMPWRPLPGMEHGVRLHDDPMTIAVRTSMILYVGWLVTTPNSYSWYDLLFWAPLALNRATVLDVLMIWRTTWLSLAFVTGRVIEFTPSLRMTGAFIRNGLCPAAQIAVFVVLVWWWRVRRDDPPQTLRHLS